MLSIKTSQASKLRTLFEISDPVLSEGPLVFSNEGMRFCGSNYVVLADCRIFACSPDITYKYTFEENKVSLGVNFKDVNDALSCVTPNDIVEIRATKDGISSARPYFTVSVMSPNNYSFTTRITLLLLETETKEAPVTNFESMVSMSSNSFLKVLRFLQRKGDYVQLYTRKCKESSESSDMAKYGIYLNIRTDDDCGHSVFSERVGDASDDCKECLKLERYNIKCLHLLAKGTNLSGIVEIFLQKNQYLAIKYRIGTIGSVIYCISPSIDDAEDAPNFKNVINEKGKAIIERKIKRPVKKARKRRVQIIPHSEIPKLV